MRFLICAMALTVPNSLLAQTDAPASTTSIIGPALRVSNAEKAVDFYTKGLGMVVSMTMEGQQVDEIMLGFSKEKPQPGIILLVDKKTNTPRPVAQGTAYSRLVLRTSNIDQAAARLSAAGYQPSATRDVAHGYRMLMVSDPDGYSYEIVQSGGSKPAKGE